MTSHETTPHCSFFCLERKEKPSQYLPSHEKGAFPICVKSPSSLSLCDSITMANWSPYDNNGGSAPLSLSLLRTHTYMRKCLHVSVSSLCVFHSLLMFTVPLYVQNLRCYRGRQLLCDCGRHPNVNRLQYSHS